MRRAYDKPYVHKSLHNERLKEPYYKIHVRFVVNDSKFNINSEYPMIDSIYDCNIHVKVLNWQWFLCTGIFADIMTFFAWFIKLYQTIKHWQLVLQTNKNHLKPIFTIVGLPTVRQLYHHCINT